MEIRSLNRFIVVAEELHFGRAAERLHIVESALSRQIQKLEEDLQLKLFDRTNRRVQLTPAGTVFLDEARSLVASFDAAVCAAQRIAAGKTGHLKVGFVGSAACEFLPAILRSFRKQWPGVELELSEMTTVGQLQNLQQNRIQIGFVRGPVPVEQEGLVFETIAREPLAVALPRNHPLAKRTRISPKALVTESFIVYPSQAMSNWEVLIRNICLKAGFKVNIVQRTIQINTAISLVSGGIGIAIVPLSAKNLPQKGVVYRRLEETAVTELLLAYRKDENSPALMNFLDSVHYVILTIQKLSNPSK